MTIAVLGTVALSCSVVLIPSIPGILMSDRIAISAASTTAARRSITTRNNPAERALRCVAIGRKNYLFAGSDAGGRRAAALYSLIESAKLNGLDPRAWLADVLGRIADHPASRLDELLPWHWAREAGRHRLAS